MLLIYLKNPTVSLHVTGTVQDFLTAVNAMKKRDRINFFQSKGYEKGNEILVPINTDVNISYIIEMTDEQHAEMKAEQEALRDQRISRPGPMMTFPQKRKTN